MTTAKCPPDCTCYGCLERMADPLCAECGGDGYVLVGRLDTEMLCKCVGTPYLKKLEKAGIIKPESQER